MMLRLTKPTLVELELGNIAHNFGGAIRKEPVLTKSRKEKPERGSLALFRKRYQFKFGTIVLVSTARLSLVSITTISNPSLLTLYV
jgi:hypothetical protein